MTPAPPPLDLLVVGGLTIDRFPDGTSVPGGSVLHIARAAASRGLRTGIVTAAGPEPEAQAGLAELRQLTALVEAAPGTATATFRHREAPEGRRLWLETSGGTVALAADAVDRIRTNAILFAPVADEVAADALTVWGEPWTRAAILQGWLRATDERGEVHPRSLATLSEAHRAALGDFDLLLASREDLLAEASDPHTQLQSLRRAFGHVRVLVVTDGAEGVWIGTAHPWRVFEPVHRPVPWRVDEAQTVGAGDILAAFMAVDDQLRPGPVDRAADAAMRVVAEVLEERRRA